MRCNIQPGDDGQKYCIAHLKVAKRLNTKRSQKSSISLKTGPWLPQALTF